MIINFVSREHEKGFFDMRSALPEQYKNDIEHLSVIYLLSGNEELKRKALPYYRPKRGVFLFTEMLEEQDFSSGMRILAKLTAVLYNRGMEVTVNELFQLDTCNLWLAFEALRLRLSG